MLFRAQGYVLFHDDYNLDFCSSVELFNSILKLKKRYPQTFTKFLFWKFKTEDVEEEIKEEIDSSAEESAQKKHLDKKRKLKEMFDAEYDEGESTYFDDLKGEMHKQAQVRKLRPCQLISRLK